MDAIETKIFATLIIAIIVLFALIGLFVANTFRKNREQVLSSRDRKAMESEIADNERERLAADLHDDLGSALSSIKLYIEGFGNNARRNRTVKNTMLESIDAAMKRIREVVLNLSPGRLETRSFSVATKEFCEMVSNARQVQINYEGWLPDSVISKEKEKHLYRILQEIITNAVRHGHPFIINIKFEMYAHAFALFIGDDGMGFDRETVRSNPGAGLRNIVNRVEQLGGTIELDTAPGKGTKYAIQIPL